MLLRVILVSRCLKNFRSCVQFKHINEVLRVPFVSSSVYFVTFIIFFIVMYNELARNSGLYLL